ncbi:MAG: sigma-54-dependent Fis family transcriptional regulator [Nitrospinae bacterium]|nr:sigma-54-dependent Fis family transcriptional regulator [Nitrospinota bacterium]
MSERRILIVDDNPDNLELLSVLMERNNWESDTAESGVAALAMMEKNVYDVVITDLMMPAMNGLELLVKTKERFPGVEVIIVTAYGSIPTAIEAIKKGAYSYLLRPFEPDDVALAIRKIYELLEIRSQNMMLREELTKALKYDKIVGASQIMRRVYELVDNVANTNSTVLIQGESGVGKELIARALHNKSPRAAGPFIKVSCAALPEPLLESELFGHEKGAFTGAVAARKGRFELADKGTLFLDEIGEITQATQVKLLRVIQEREFERIGGNKTISTDVRIITATNKNLPDEVAKGNFREDLFYRLNVIAIDVPPLRERRQDIPTLAYHFLERYATETGRSIRAFTDEALAMMSNYPWPGNVRELQNVVERAVALTRDEVIDEEDLPENVRGPAAFSDLPDPEPGDTGVIPLRMAKGAWEKSYIERTLRKFGGNITHAADALELARKNLQEKIKAYDIDVSRFVKQ